MILDFMDIATDTILHCNFPIDYRLVKMEPRWVCVGYIYANMTHKYENKI